jgi:hypothetical protein
MNPETKLHGQSSAGFSVPDNINLPGMPRLHNKAHGTVYVNFDVEQNQFEGVPEYARPRVLEAVKRTIGFEAPVSIRVVCNRRYDRGILDPTYYIQAVQIAAKNAMRFG